MEQVYHPAMTARALHVVADIIRRISDDVLRREIAHHFGAQLKRRYPTFNIEAWEKAARSPIEEKSDVGG